MEQLAQTQLKSEDAKSYLSFFLAKERYAILVSKVVEILEVPEITKVPKTPAYMLGVINLRGSVLPIVDVNIKFDMEAQNLTINSCIVVMKIMLDGEQTRIGLLVDNVEEVLPIAQEQISEAPSIAGKFKAKFLEGMAKVEEEFLMLLDIDAIMNESDAAILKSMENEQQHAQTDQVE